MGGGLVFGSNEKVNTVYKMIKNMSRIISFRNLTPVGPSAKNIIIKGSLIHSPPQGRRAYREEPEALLCGHHQLAPDCRGSHTQGASCGRQEKPRSSDVSVPFSLY